MRRFAMLLLALPTIALAQGHQRGSWYIGFGLGSGGGWVNDGGERASFRDFTYEDDRVTVGFNFNVGATLTPRLLLGGELGGIGTFGEYQGYETSITTSYIDAVLTFFPVERGPFLRGGLGRTVLAIEQEDPYYGDFKGDWDGYNVLGGIGYAWWLGRSFNLVGQVDVMRSWYESSGPDSTDSVHVTLGFEWY